MIFALSCRHFLALSRTLRFWSITHGASPQHPMLSRLMAVATGYEHMCSGFQYSHGRTGAFERSVVSVFSNTLFNVAPPIIAHHRSFSQPCQVRLDDHFVPPFIQLRYDPFHIAQRWLG